MTIGFIGTGRMGAEMARHLARGGHELILLDADREACAALAAELGAHHAKTAAEVGAGSEIVVLMLPDGKVVRRIVTGPDGLAGGLGGGALVVDCTSAEPWLTEETARAVEATGATMIDAPVSGAVWGARDGDLVFMVGGDPADVERARPLFDLMGRAVFHLGPLPSGHRMKCINNAITSATMAATTEGLLMGKAAGLDPRAMIDVLNESTGGSWVARTHYNKRIFNRAFDDPFKLELMLKDVGICTGLAEALGVPAPMMDLTRQMWTEADRAAGPGQSVSEYVRWAEKRAGRTLD